MKGKSNMGRLWKILCLRRLDEEHDKGGFYRALEEDCMDYIGTILKRSRECSRIDDIVR